MISYISTAITCTSLIAPDNGFITYAPDTSEPFEFRTTARYGCNNGFGLSRGDTVRTCGAANQGGEQWSGTAPTCERKLFCMCWKMVIKYRSQI